MINKRLLVCPLVVATIALPAGPAAAVEGDPAHRCGRAVVLGSGRILRSDTQVLSRCLLAILAPAPPGDVEKACSKLRTPGLRLERVDLRSRGKIERRCGKAVPAWLPRTCQGPGPARGVRLDEAGMLAHCAATGSHCTALAALEASFTDALGPLLDQHPDNLSYAFGGIEGNAFVDCLDLEPPVTTTSTTVPTTVPSTSTTSTTSTTTTMVGPTTTTLPTGDDIALVITEIMANPSAQSDAAGEFFEVLNAGNAAIDLAGLVVGDLGSDSFTVDQSMVVAAGQYAVFAKSETAADGLGDFVYGGGMNLTNSADEIVLMLGGEIVDQVVYDATFPVIAGRSMQVVAGAENANANDDAASWCAADSALADGDFGSPGAGGGACLP